MTEQKPIHSGFGAKTTAEEALANQNLSGKVAIVTGGHAGLGLETTRVLTKAGATVIVGARDVEKAKAAVADFKNVEVLPLDLANPAAIDQFANDFKKSNRALDLLINNAGVMATPLTRDARGYEIQFATNHLGHFQLTGRLWEPLKKSGHARVIALSSYGHTFGAVDLKDPNYLDRPYDKWDAYGQSKTANSLFAVELDARGKNHGVRAFAVHPGGIITDLIRHMSEEELNKFGISREDKTKIPERFKTIPEGAATTIWCAVSPQLKDRGGVYCADCEIAPLVEGDMTVKPDANRDLNHTVRSWAIDPQAAAGLWTLSEKLTSISFE